MFKRTIKITAEIYSGYISYIRTDTGAEIARNKSALQEWARLNNVNVELDTLAQSATSYE